MDGSAPHTMRAAVIQMTSGADRDANIAHATELVTQAVIDGAQLVVLPETWNRMAGISAAHADAESLDGSTIECARGWATAHGIWIIAGSIAERIPGSPRIANTSVVIGPDGDLRGSYRKQHLFDAQVAGHQYRESEYVEAGDALCVVDIGACNVGVSVCYDLRFPEIYRAMIDRGAQVFAIPSAFTARTGQAHWEILVRARAIENLAYVCAANQVGRHADGSESYGHSMIVDPWGDVVARAPDGPGIAVATLDMSHLEDIRATFPALTHRRIGWDGEDPASSLHQGPSHPAS